MWNTYFSISMQIFLTRGCYVHDWPPFIWNPSLRKRKKLPRGNREARRAAVRECSAPKLRRYRRIGREPPEQQNLKGESRSRKLRPTMQLYTPTSALNARSPSPPHPQSASQKSHISIYPWVLGTSHQLQNQNNIVWRGGILLIANS